MAVSGIDERTFFERQQRRRRAIQARLTGKPVERRPAQPAAPPAPARPAQPPAPPGPPAPVRASAPEPAATAVTQARAMRPAAPPAPVLLAISGADKGERFGLTSGELIIGRERGSAVRLEDRSVSHNHALLRVEGTQVTIEDRGSRNGTRVNGTLIERQTPLAPGDQIDVGAVRLLLSIDSD